MAKQTLGKLPAAAFGMLELPHVAIRYPRRLSRAAGSDRHCVGCDGRTRHCRRCAGRRAASADPKARIVGRALTVHNIAAAAPVPDRVKAGVSGLGEIEAHNLAEPGDVLVVQGVDQVSNLGGMSATIGHRQGEIGAIVDGGARDIDHSRAIGLPVWSKSVSPITGKWRVETVAVNKPVSICGMPVNPGDLVLADETGVCFIPRERAGEVLARATKNAAAEKLREEKIAAGVPIRDLIAKAK